MGNTIVKIRIINYNCWTIHFFKILFIQIFMKANKIFSNSWLLFVPLFIFGVCNKEGDESSIPTSDQYVTWNMSGASGFLQVPTDSLDFYYTGFSTAIYGMTKPTPNTSFGISIVGSQQSGRYSADYFSVYASGKYYVPTTTPLQVNISNYGASGQYGTGTYSGMVKDSATSAIISVNGEFRIRNR